MTDQILTIEGIFIVAIFVIAILIFLGMLIEVFITFRSTNRAGTESKSKKELIAQPRKIKKVPSVFHELHVLSGTAEDLGRTMHDELSVNTMDRSTELDTASAVL